MIDREKLIDMVTSVQNGSREAAADMYHAFRDDFYYFILKTVNNDRHLAEDITQDTFVHILKKIRTLEEPAAFVTWAKQIAYHKCTDYFKKRKEILLDENEDGDTLFDIQEEENAEFIPDCALEKEDLKRTILNMINELPEEQRSALLLRYFNEIPIKEIAQIQSVTEGTVKSRLNYARKAIKQSVEAYEKKNGIKLHCAGVIPMLLWLFRQYRLSNKLSLTRDMASQTFPSAQGTVAAGATEISKSVTAGSSGRAAGAVTTSGNASASTVASTTVTKAAVGTGVKAAVSALSTKVLAGVAAVALAVCGTMVGVAMGFGNEKHQQHVTEQTPTAFVEQASGQSTIDSTEELVPEHIQAPCDHVWKPLYCLYEFEGNLIPWTYYGCTTCGATVCGEGCPHPEVKTIEITSEYGSYTQESCSLCGENVTAHYRQYMTAPGGAGLPDFAWPDTYREAEVVPADGCTHAWKVVSTKLVPTELEGSIYGVCTFTYKCDKCAAQLEGSSNHMAHIMWEGDTTCYECENSDVPNSACAHTQVFKFYHNSVFGSLKYYLICKDCNTAVLEGIPVESNSGASSGNIREAYIPVLQQYESDYNSEGMAQEYLYEIEYTLYDIDKDGIPELIVSEGGLHHVYTVHDGSAVHCGDVYGYWGLWGCEDNGLIVHDGGLGIMRVESMYRVTLSNCVLEGTGKEVCTGDDTWEEFEAWKKQYFPLMGYLPLNDYSLLE